MVSLVHTRSCIDVGTVGVAMPWKSAVLQGKPKAARLSVYVTARDTCRLTLMC